MKKSFKDLKIKKFGEKGKFKGNILISTVLIQIISTAVIMLLLSVVMNLLETDAGYAPIFATVAVSIGAMVSSYRLSSKRKSRGYLNGITVGISTFAIITVISFFVDGGGITFNTLFHLILIMLSSLIGGIAGVNKKEKSYI